MNLCDIILEPIYDPFNRPRYLAQLNVYAEAGSPPTTRSSRGTARPVARRDQPADRGIDAAGERREVLRRPGRRGSGGQTITLQEDAASIIKFGEYWRQQFFPSQTVAAVVQALARAQVDLSAAGRVTVALSPAPERSPQPFLDYFLGDRVPVYASQRFRAPIPAADESSSDQQNYQRVYGIPLIIGDDSVERVTQLLTAIPA